MFLLRNTNTFHFDQRLLQIKKLHCEILIKENENITRRQ